MNWLLRRFSVRVRAKLLAILGAILLYYYVQNLKITEVTLNIPLVVINRPQSVALSGELPRFVQITIAGREESLKFSTGSLRAELNLAEADTKKTRYPVEFDENQLPASVILRKKPAPLELRFEKVVRRRLPLRVITSGAPDSAYRVTRIMLRPDTVVVEAPESAFRNLKEITTATLSLDGVTANFARRLRLQIPAAVVSADISDTEAVVNVMAIATGGEKQFDAIPIRILNLDPALEATLSDKSVRVVISGDRDGLKKINAADISASVDLGDTRYNPRTGSILPYEVEQGLQVKVKLLRTIKDVGLTSFAPENISVRFRVKEEYKRKEDSVVEGKSP